MTFLIIILVFWSLIIGQEAKTAGRNVFLWIILAIVSYFIAAVIAFVAFSNFIPCNPEECNSVIYGAICGNLFPLVLAIYLYSQNKSK